MMVSMHWFILILNLPVAAWDVYRYVKVPLGNMGVFDPTEIHNRGQLKTHMKESMIKLGFHLLCFFIYLYRRRDKMVAAWTLPVTTLRPTNQDLRHALLLSNYSTDRSG
ncbi:hypothetical protein NHX12_000868 [Muraenolepis orangiensis]|uniref:Uncharacterized protein n=1 Tax=Muraenolepis orangiensis TaxID=630683 RepID=A0A9Q0IGJ0_9TELE|nr:hypothetical protein NHX12_000868 [Muraenolepis orangiensis]